MKIAIIGTSHVGGALAQRLVKAGHEIAVGARQPLSQTSRQLETQLGSGYFTTVAEAVSQSEVVLIAIQPQDILSVINEMGDVSGKVIIDATNTRQQKPVPYSNAYEALVDKTKAEIVKCFNSTGFENMLNPVYGSGGIDMFMAGDSDAAKAVAKQLALDCGFAACYDFGRGNTVPQLEQLAFIWVTLAHTQAMGSDIAFKLVKR